MQQLKLSALVLFMFLFTSNIQAQSPNPFEDPYSGTFTFFTDEGENITVFLNGEQINKTPMPNVQAEERKEASVQVRIVFEDQNIPPVKKQLMRMGKNCTYIVKKNKNGEYVVNLKSAEGTYGPPREPVSVSAPTSPAAAAGYTPAPAQGTKLTATTDGSSINLSDGRSFTITKARTPGNWPSPHVIMKAPTGAKVTITYDDGTNTYNTEVPFDYEVSNYEHNNHYFKLTVDEGGPDRTWYVRLQNSTSYQLTIE